MALLSAKSRQFLQKEIRLFGFQDFFAFVESIGDKRHGVNGLVARLAGEKGSVLFVGDMPHDVETAKHASIRSVGVLNGYSPREKLLAAKPDYAIEKTSELPALIERIDGGKA